MKQNNQNKKYIEKFYEPKFTPYDFIFLFSAVNANNKNYSFNKDNLISYIKLCNENFKFTNLTKEIPLKNNGISSFSEELDEAIAKLKWARILYTISPEKDSTIHIFEDIPTSEIIKPRIDYLEEMYDFIQEYNKFENEIINKYYKKLAEQETKDIDKAIHTLTKIKKQPTFKTIK